MVNIFKNSLRLCALVSFFGYSAQPTNQEMEAIRQTGIQVRQAFVEQDVDKILTYHHLKVVKALSWESWQYGHNDMKEQLTALFRQYQLVFFDDQSTAIENVEVFDDMAILIRTFKLKGVPKQKQLNAFVFQGRVMLVLTRSEHSPTGWVTLRVYYSTNNRPT
jgi:hypothetical protein